MQPKDFRYVLIIRDKEYTLNHSPSGWEESTLRWARSEEYFGLIRSFSLPLKFVEFGAKLLRNEFYTYGIEGKATLRIDILNKNTWQYNQLYLGQIDFSTVDDDITGIEVNIADMGIESSIKAYEDVVYEFDIENDPEAVTVVFPNIDIVGYAQIRLFSEEERQHSITSAMTIVDSDMDSIYVDLQETFQEPLPDQNPFIDPQLTGNENWFLKANQNMANVYLGGSLTVEVPKPWIDPDSTDRIDRQISVIKESGDIIWTKVFQYVPSMPIQYADLELSTSMTSGEKLYLVIWAPFVPSKWPERPNLISIVDSYISTGYSLSTGTTKAKAYHPKILFEKLVEKMTGQRFDVPSYFLSEWNRLLITSGDAVREINGGKLKTSFSDFFKSMNSVGCAGFGMVNDMPTIERRDYFFNKILKIFDVGDIKDFSLKVSKNYVYNSVRVGYPDKDYGKEIGREEYNSEQEYSLPITRIKKRYDILSVYRADQFGITELLINKFEKNFKKEDSKSDNDVFFILAKPDPLEGEWHYEGSEAFQEVTGISTRTSAMNLGITPHKNLLRHIDFLGAPLIEGDVIRFESAKKNANLETVALDGNSIKESDDIEFKGDKTILPYEIEFKVGIKNDVQETMKNLSTGFVEFRYKGSKFMGFILETSIDVAKNSEQEYKLLLTPLNDISLLIH